MPKLVLRLSQASHEFPTQSVVSGTVRTYFSRVESNADALVCVQLHCGAQCLVVEVVVTCSSWLSVSVAFPPVQRIRYIYVVVGHNKHGKEMESYNGLDWNRP